MSNLERSTDTDLISAFRAGDPDAFAEIYARYSDRVFAGFIAAGHDREAAASATRDTFDEAASQLELQDQPSDLGAWLLDIATGMDDRSSVAVDGAAPAALRPRVLGEVDRGITLPSVSLTPDAVRWGIFAIVALVAGLIGFVVSGQVDPLQPRGSTPEAVDPSPIAVTTTTNPGAPPTTGGGSATTATSAPATTAPATPAEIEVSTDRVEFGDDATVAGFELTNSGGQPGEWALTTSSDAVSLSVDQGRLAAGETATVEVSLDRETVDEGDLEEIVTLTWSGGEVEIALVGTNEANPIIHNPQASPGQVQVAGNPECTSTQTTVSARVRDASPLETVVARWSPDGGATRETEMVSVGNDMFEAVVGPFTTARTAEVRIVAFDDRGNAGGASAQVSVVACP